MGFLIWIVYISIIALFAYAVIKEAVKNGIYDAYKKIEKDKENKGDS